MRLYTISLLEHRTQVLVYILITFAIFGCVSDTKSVADESDCNVQVIDRTFKQRDLQSLKDKHDQKPVSQISLNDSVMSLATAVNLGFFAREKNIPISVVGKSVCDDECPIPYLLAKRRYAISDMEFPKY